MDTADVPDFGAVCNNLAAYTWADRCAAFSHCESTSYVPWLWLYHCSISERFDFSSAAVIVQIVCDIALTPFVIFFGAKLLVKVRASQPTARQQFDDRCPADTLQRCLPARCTRISEVAFRH